MLHRTARRSRQPRWLAAATLSMLAVAACGSDGSAPNADSTTLAPGGSIGEVEPVGSDPETPSDTITPPDDTLPPLDTIDPSENPPTSEEEPVVTSADDPTELTPTQERLADVAIDDVVDRRGVERSRVTVVEVAEVIWSDASLGCPQRDMQYQQVLTPGIRVIVEADGQRAFYHGTSAVDLTYCAAPQPPVDA